MRLVRPDLAERAVEAFRVASEWPHYSIFVCLTCYDSFVIAPRTMLHGDLFVLLRQEWLSRSGPNITIEDRHVFDGHIEWEDDGTILIRNERGERLPHDIEQEIRTILTTVLANIP